MEKTNVTWSNTDYSLEIFVFILLLSYALTVVCQRQNVTHIKLGAGTYQVFLLPGM